MGPNQNVYAELGSTWWTIMRDPTQASHVLGKLLRYVGEDNVLWGTDCIFYGSPQDQIQTFRSFEISSEFQERYGYPELTRERKAKILGLQRRPRLRDRAANGQVRVHAPRNWRRSGARSAPSTPPTGRGTRPRSSGSARITRDGRGEPRPAGHPISGAQHQPLMLGNARRCRSRRGRTAGDVPDGPHPIVARPHEEPLVGVAPADQQPTPVGRPGQVSEPPRSREQLPREEVLDVGPPEEHNAAIRRR